MPKCADHEHVELLEYFALEGASLVYALAQPLLHTYVPVAYLIPDMHARLDHPRVTGVHMGETVALEAHS